MDKGYAIDSKEIQCGDLVKVNMKNRDVIYRVISCPCEHDYSHKKFAICDFKYGAIIGDYFDTINELIKHEKLKLYKKNPFLNLT